MLVIGALAIAAIAAMFPGKQQSVSGRRQNKPWWLGADLAHGTPSTFGGMTGVRIKRVWSHSPARAAGLESGDIILQINGMPVSTPAEVEAILSAPGAPRRMDLVVLSDRQTLSLSVPLQERPDFLQNVAVVLAVLATVFALLYCTRLDRVAVVGCAAVLSVILGIGFGFYDQHGAFAAIRMSTLALLLGMGLITVALEETGFFAVVAAKVGELSHGDWSRLMVLLCITTYVLSALVNNLTTILVILPVTLGLARKFHYDPTPFVIGEIVSSNLGGASSMIGDFPNMLIASETGRHFHDFLLYMMPPCLVQLGITIWFMKGRKPNTPRPQTAAQQPVPQSKDVAHAPALVPGKRAHALAVLTAVIVVFFFCGTLAVPPATVALAGGFAILLLWNRGAPRLLGKAGFSDILFFVGLFVLVGCAEASGLLDIIASWIVDVSGGGLVGLALVLMWAAAVVTTFLNAGPATALFVPIVMGLGVSEAHGLLWWALSLGVCAGSSATITGATAGPVALTKLEEFAKEIKGAAASAPAVRLSFIGYARVGVPLMFIFLLFSSAYIWVLSRS
ncbi:MAG: SLC13 family permease [Planctomycetota bacterium]|jgi:Na+/H+ antiporter NhaD/arsenite permease-like protein